jgi:hypothetical protein
LFSGQAVPRDRSSRAARVALGVLRVRRIVVLRALLRWGVGAERRRGLAAAVGAEFVGGVAGGGGGGQAGGLVGREHELLDRAAAEQGGAEQEAGHGASAAASAA